MTKDELFVESVGDGCLQVCFGAMVLFIVLGTAMMLVCEGCKMLFGK